MKNKLESLKVKNFVTNLKRSKNTTIKGGDQTIYGCIPPQNTTTVDSNGGNCIQMGHTMDAYCMSN